jgi:hypothetical protein
MITISKRVEQIIERWPLIKQGLDSGLINLSSLARQLRPEIEEEIGERISDAAVLMALRRYQTKNSGGTSVLSSPAGFLGDISLRSGLSDLTYTNTPTLSRKIGKLADDINPQLYLTVSRGLLQTSVIVHQDALARVERILKGEHLESRVTALTAITLHLRPGHDEVAGVLAHPLNLLAWRGISVIELVSTFDELNIVLYDKDIEEAFRVLNQATI